jgi:hypothetical protein
MEFEGGLGDVLYLEGTMGPSSLVTGDDERIAQFRDDFETLLDESMTQENSIELLRRIAEEMMT